MKKIPTLFVRDENDRRYVTREVTPGCEWVLRGEGVATYKWDGTCVMHDAGGWWFRREVKGDKYPAGFIPVEKDEVTGKTFGWEPAEQSGFYKMLLEALKYQPDLPVGTYELIGPKINGNRHGIMLHTLMAHGEARVPGTAGDVFGMLYEVQGEGIVWWHPDGRKAKLKIKDIREGE